MSFAFSQLFDATKVDPSQFPAPPPLDDYKVYIVGSEMKTTNDNTGGYLELTLKIYEGQYNGREIPYRLNLYNSNQKTMEIAYRQLSALCHAVGVFQLQDSSQLHNLPFIANIGPQKNDPAYANVYRVMKADGSMPGNAAGASVAAIPAAVAPQAPAQPPAGQAPAPVAPMWAAAGPTHVPPPVAQQPASFAPPQQQWQPPAGQAPAPVAPAQPVWTPPAAAAAPPTQPNTPPWASQGPAAGPTPPTWSGR